MNITIDKDCDLNYEYNNFLRKTLNVFLIPILNMIPRSAQKFIKKTHRSANDVIEERTTYYALDILYKDGIKENATNLINKLFHKIWFGTNNSKAVRNRLRLTKREISKQLERLLASKKKRIKILSIASGSARAIVEVLDKAKDRIDKKKIEVIFLDKDHKAIEYSQRLASSKNLLSFFELKWINDTAGSFFRSLDEDNTFDIIEMVGLIDYFSDEKALQMFSHVNKHLSEDGLFITANISDNRERPFVTKVIEWSMVYRSAEQLGEVLSRANFNNNKMGLFYEPLKIHCVAVCIK